MIAEMTNMTLKVIHKDNNHNIALVQDGNKPSFPVLMQKWLRNLVCVGDLAIIKKSPVSGEWILTDYVRVIDNIGEDL